MKKTINFYWMRKTSKNSIFFICYANGWIFEQISNQWWAEMLSSKDSCE